jgi:hypothetical protein
MNGSRRRTWADMNHDDALLRKQIVRLSRVDERGPIAELLAKKDAEQASRPVPAIATRRGDSWDGADRVPAHASPLRARVAC